MTLIEQYFIYCLIGKLLIYLVQKSPYAKFIGDIIGRESVRRFLLELLECDLCLGVWIFSLLAWIMKINMYSFYVPIVSEIIVGSSTSFVVHLVSIGWKEKFSIINLG